MTRHAIHLAGILIGMLTLGGPGASAGRAQPAALAAKLQQRPGSANLLVLQASPFAGYAGYARRLSDRWYGGAGLGGGAGLLLVLSGAAAYDDHKEGGQTGLFLGYQPAPFFLVEASPLRLSLLVGNDYAAVYPSASVAVMAGTRTFKAGPQLVLVRVAGPNGTGDYPLFWVPLNLRYTFSW